MPVKTKRECAYADCDNEPTVLLTSQGGKITWSYCGMHKAVADAVRKRLGFGPRLA